MLALLSNTFLVSIIAMSLSRMLLKSIFEWSVMIAHASKSFRIVESSPLRLFKFILLKFKDDTYGS